MGRADHSVALDCRATAASIHPLCRMRSRRSRSHVQPSTDYSHGAVPRMRMEAIAQRRPRIRQLRGTAHTSGVAHTLEAFGTALGHTLRLPDEDVVQYTLVQSQ